MTPAQMADRLAEVDRITRASVQRTKTSCGFEVPGIDDGACTNPRCPTCARTSPTRRS